MKQLPSFNVVYQSREDYVFLKISAFLFVALISDAALEADDHLASASGPQQTCAAFRY
jgi:hypothetical protein